MGIMTGAGPLQHPLGALCDMLISLRTRLARAIVIPLAPRCEVDDRRGRARAGDLYLRRCRR